MTGADLKRIRHELGEQWRPILVDGSPTNYSVSSLGRIRHKRGRIIRGRASGGAHRTCLMINKRKRDFKTHRLVALAFLGPAPLGKPLVLHSDSNHLNNAASNLRWGSHKDNFGDRVAILGPLIRWRGSNMKAAEFASIRSALGISQSKWGEMLGLNIGTVGRMERGQTSISKTVAILARIHGANQ